MRARARGPSKFSHLYIRRGRVNSASATRCVMYVHLCYIAEPEPERVPDVFGEGRTRWRLARARTFRIVYALHPCALPSLSLYIIHAFESCSSSSSSGMWNPICARGCGCDARAASPPPSRLEDGLIFREITFRHWFLPRALRHPACSIAIYVGCFPNVTAARRDEILVYGQLFVKLLSRGIYIGYAERPIFNIQRDRFLRSGKESPVKYIISLIYSLADPPISCDVKLLNQLLRIPCSIIWNITLWHANKPHVFSVKILYFGKPTKTDPQIFHILVFLRKMLVRTSCWWAK